MDICVCGQIDWFNTRTLKAQPEGSTGSLLKLKVTGMGCVACVNQVMAVLEKRPEVVQAQVHLETGVATVQLKQEQPEQELLALAAALTDTGFTAEVLSQQAAPSSEKQQQPAAKPAADKEPGALSPMQQLLRDSSCVAAGLLGSSCCVLQLLLNFFSVGCAGFNKVLGPWRLQLRTLTGAWLGALWMQHLFGRKKGGGKEKEKEAACCRAQRRRLIISTTLTLLLTFLPEILLFAGAPGGGLAPPTHSTQRMTLAVGGMGCEACQFHVKGVLERTPGVIGTEVDFKAGSAELLIARNWGFDLQQAQKILEYDGYELSIKRVEEEVDGELRVYNVGGAAGLEGLGLGAMKWQKQEQKRASLDSPSGVDNRTMAAGSL